jgi:hypothetical protein
MTAGFPASSKAYLFETGIPAVIVRPLQWELERENRPFVRTQRGKLPYPFFRSEVGAFFAVRLDRFALFFVVVFLWVVFFFAGA